MRSDCKDSASKTNYDGVCEMNDMLQNMNTVDGVSVCANCGKDSDVNNTCNKCKKVKYCNAACKKKHRHKHKKDCEEHLRVAAKHAAKLHDEKLFKQPPPKEDCPICFLQLPSIQTGWRYQACCGKVICSGCIRSPVYDDHGNTLDNQKCAFCRIPKPNTAEEAAERDKKRMEKDDPIAIYNIGVYHRHAMTGFPQDYTKALELWHRAGELGYAGAYNNIGYSYMYGEGVEVNEEKAIQYYELAAMMGNVNSRLNLGRVEESKCNMNRALKHYMISVRSGCADPLKMIKKLYSDGYATKENYSASLQAYQTYLGEIKSAQRDKAAADDENCRYY